MGIYRVRFAGIAYVESESEKEARDKFLDDDYEVRHIEMDISNATEEFTGQELANIDLEREFKR